MRHRYGFIVASFTALAALVACGGGGGGSATPPAPGVAGSIGTTPTTAPSIAPTGGASASPKPGATATPTPTPTGIAVTLPSSAPANPSQIAVNSNPAGLSVTVDGMAAGVTPATPSAGYGAHTIVVTPQTAASPYAVKVSNTGNAPISVFYNQTADSSGKIGGGIATSSVARSAQANAAFAIRRGAASAANRSSFAAGMLSVSYDPAAFGGARTFASVESAHGIARAQTLAQSSSRVTRVVTLGAGRDLDATLAAMRGEAGVVEVSRVGLRYPAATSTGTVYPNDTYFEATNNGANGDQWYLWLIDAQDAWGYGAGKAPIAVIDTGYDPNQTELAGLVTNAETIVNLTLYPNTATDTDGHGTFLSGVAGAQTNNGAGFAGVAYNAPLQEYKIFADGGTSAQTSDEAAAIRDAVKYGAKVILLALQSSPGNGPDPIERDAVAYAIANGVTVVAASGDDNGTALDYPAGYPGVISVGASIVNDTGTPGVVIGQGNGEAVASYSNAGPGLTLVAPGGQGTGSDPDLLHWIENVYTTQPSAGLPACAGGATPANCRILFTGTSPAAALVAGTAALMLTVNGALAPAQVAQMLAATTDDIHDAKEGAGRLDAQRAVALAAGDASPQPAFPLPRAVQFVAIAYTNSGATLPVAPAIVDSAYPNGVPVNPDGTFRIADVNPASLAKGTSGYKVGVWLSLAGDGKVHPGDYFASASCSISGACGAIGNLTVAKITGSTLP
jgi:hypothetical protein